MAFAQFYYDPALEFEKLLDEDTGGGSEAGQAPAAPIAAAGDAKAAKCTEQGVMYAVHARPCQHLDTSH